MDNFKIVKGKKFMWDGEDYPSKDAAQQNISKYQKEGFETILIEEEGKFLVYSRRVIADVVVEGQPI